MERIQCFGSGNNNNYACSACSECKICISKLEWSRRPAKCGSCIKTPLLDSHVAILKSCLRNTCPYKEILNAESKTK
jgi:hypothetical protein